MAVGEGGLALPREGGADPLHESTYKSRGAAAHHPARMDIHCQILLLDRRYGIGTGHRSRAKEFAQIRKNIDPSFLMFGPLTTSTPRWRSS